MSSARCRVRGRPAADPAKALAFYGDLFGWKTTEFAPGYHLIENGPTGAITTSEEGFTQPRVYLATTDIEATVKRIHELGGTAEDLQTIPNVGRITHCRDNQNTPFSLYEPQS